MSENAAAILASAALSREPPQSLVQCPAAELVRRATTDRLAFLAYLKAEFGLPLGDRQRVANAIARMERAASHLTPAPRTRTRRFASAQEAIDAGQVAFVTLTNTGYLSYTQNCLTSLDVVNEPVPLTVYCADTPSHEKLSRTHSRVVPMHEEGPT